MLLDSNHLACLCVVSRSQLFYYIACLYWASIWSCIWRKSKRGGLWSSYACIDKFGA